MIILKPWAVYNEIEEYAADWLENLITLGAIAPGVVDRRSIIDVRPDDYRGFRQAHFFAGIGVWSYSLRRAGVSDDTALWTGSCPCQPFSAAGAGGGVDDERHLWPHWFHLINAVRPPRIYGEQVASKDGLGWLDLVCADLEGSDYSIWAVDTCSASGGAPHIRQRIRFCAEDLRPSAVGLADRHLPGLEVGCGGPDEQHGAQGWEAQERFTGLCDVSDWMADDSRIRSGFDSGFGPSTGTQGGDPAGEEEREWVRFEFSTGVCGDALPLADSIDRHVPQPLRGAEGRDGSTATYAKTAPERPRPTNGFWGDADWLFCRDAKWRPVEPGTFPLVDGSAFHLGSGSTFEGKSRQGMLKGYGNAIDAEATIDFIEATLEADTIDIEPVGDDFDDLLG